MPDKPTSNPGMEEDALDILREAIDAPSAPEAEGSGSGVPPVGPQMDRRDARLHLPEPEKAAPMTGHPSRRWRLILSLATLVIAATVGGAALGIGPTWLTEKLGHDPKGQAVATTNEHGGDSEQEVLYWYDPMHPSYKSDKPGIAPDCGMKLVPKYAAEMGSMQSEHASADSHDPQNQSERKVLYWFDPMHPSYKSDKPGIAPDCGMKLVPKYADEMEAMKNMAPGTVMVSAQKQQMIGIKTEEAKVVRLEKTIRTVGRVDYDETKLARVHTKIPGWIEKVYVDYVGQMVKKGEPLFTVYSPELVSTQEEYLLALRAHGELVESSFEGVSRGAQSLLASTRRRLELWDISDEQIERLARSGQAQKTLTLYAPVDGVVLKRNAYEQMRITAETNIYEIADLSTVWVYADIYEYEMPIIKEGQTATMKLSYVPGRTLKGKLTYVYPFLEGKTRTLKVRMEFPNPDLKLRPDMYADVEIKVLLGNALVVSEEAVMDSGMRQLVFVDKGQGYFEPRDVKLGLKVDDHYQILEGLKPGERVVTSANFLIDSESRLTSATGGMSHSH